MRPTTKGSFKPFVPDAAGRINVRLTDTGAAGCTKTDS